MSDTSHPARECLHLWHEMATKRKSRVPGMVISANEIRGPVSLTCLRYFYPECPHSASRRLFLTFLTGSEGKSQRASERKGGDPVSLHTVARHGSSRVRPPGPDFREEILSSTHAGDGPCVGALQVGLASCPSAWIRLRKWAGPWSGLEAWPAVALLLSCLI